MVRFPPGDRAARCLAVVTAVLFLSSGCGGGNSEAADSPSATLATAPETTSTTEPELTVEEEVEAAYHEANQAFFTLMEDPSLPLDDLHATRTGESLEHVLGSVERIRDSGEFSSYPTGYPIGEVLRVEVDGDLAEMEACEINDAIVSLPDGTILNDDVEFVLAEVTLVRADGTWRVKQEFFEFQKPGEKPCGA